MTRKEDNRVYAGVFELKLYEPNDKERG